MPCTWGPTSGVRLFLSSGRQEMFVRRIPNKGRGGHFWGVSFERVLTEENVPWTFLARLTSSLIDALSTFFFVFGFGPTAVPAPGRIRVLFIKRAI